MNGSRTSILAACSLCALLVVPGTVLAQQKPKESDKLTVHRLETNGVGKPKENTNFKNLPLAENGKPEQGSLTIPKTIYAFGDAPGPSDFWFFDSYKIHFYSDPLAASVTKQLDEIQYTLRYDEISSGINVTVPVVKMDVESFNTVDEGNKQDKPSDKVKISTDTVDKNDKPYSVTGTLTGAEEKTKALTTTVPKQAIKIYENGTLSDVVIIDPISFQFESDFNDKLEIPPDAIRFVLDPEKVNQAAFSVQISSDGNVPEGSTLATLGIGLIALGSMLLRKPGFRRAG